MNDFILDRLKEINQLQNSIKLNNLNYKVKSGKNYNFSITSLPSIFLRNIHTGVISIKDADKEESKLFKELSNINKSEKQVDKSLL